MLILKQILDRDNKIILFSVASILILIVNIVIISIGDLNTFKTSRPLFLGVMITMYITVAKKCIKLFLLTQLLFFIGEIIQFNFENLFVIYIRCYKFR